MHRRWKKHAVERKKTRRGWKTVERGAEKWRIRGWVIHNGAERADVPERCVGGWITNRVIRHLYTGFQRSFPLLYCALSY